MSDRAPWFVVHSTDRCSWPTAEQRRAHRQHWKTPEPVTADDGGADDSAGFGAAVPLYASFGTQVADMHCGETGRRRTPVGGHAVYQHVLFPPSYAPLWLGVPVSLPMSLGSRLAGDLTATFREAWASGQVETRGSGAAALATHYFM